jgi:lysine 2,3-aminomutase
MTEVTLPYVHRLTPYLEAVLRDKPDDHPLARQFLPDVRELDARPYERSDPIGDLAHSPVKGIVHRHRDRALLKLHLFCPAYCRFCFRRESLGRPGEALTDAEVESALEYVARHPEIWEIILTGGDPLAWSARRMRTLLERLGEIAHVAVVRIHTRVPVIDPAMIDNELAGALALCARDAVALYVAVHVNHPEELTRETVAALARLRGAGATLLSQTVLLKGVNDDADTLEALFRGLVRQRVKPYYLHHADLAPGTSHFRVSIELGQKLMRRLRARMSGLCLPTYVLDLPGGAGKVPIGPTYEMGPTADGERRLLDLGGGAQVYPE